MRYAIGIDTGGTTIKAAVVSETGELRDRLTVPTPADPTRLIEVASGIVTDLSARGTPVIDTIGFDIPGIVNDRAGIGEFSANLHWRDFPARDELESATGRPVAFGHDVRTGAFAESHWGAGHDDFFFIAIGTGIATVLVLDSHPVATGGWIGELGQLLIENRCGQTVALETVCSASGIAATAREAGLVGADAGAAQVYALHDDGNEDASAIIDFAIAALARSLAPIVCAIGPIPIVIGGGLANRGQDLLDHLGRHLRTSLGIVPPPPLETAQLGSWAQVQGAALRAFLFETAESERN